MSGTSGFMRQGDAERTGGKIGGDFLIVGIGASAGGIGALKEFFENVPADSGVAYVVILHLSPDHDSQLAEVLQTVARIPVTQVTEKVRVEPDHVYVVPPDRSLKLVDGHIVVQPIHTVEERRAPVDIFFRTMAETLGGRAVCVVLSGTGANGSMGLKRVKEGGGVALVQNPRQAEYSDMPRNSIATDLVDAILNVAEIPAKVVAYKNSLGRIEIPVEPEARPEEQQQALREIFTQLRVRTGHDFSSYKRSTVLRRIERRINVRELSDLPSYAAYLRESADEAQSLLKDLLISVTNFFRDKEAFAYLETEVLPRLLDGKKSDDGIRVWVAGCATGEEAYSIAMLLAERALGGLDAPEIQIFASDIDAAAIAKAREGLYTLNDAADVTPERLRRFFTKEAHGFRVRRELREMVLFANHNVIKDPPFSHLDLVSCRNMMIYLNGMAQERVMEVMHFALNPGGYLFLGSAESVDGAGDLYAPVSREHHIFQSRPVAARLSYPVPDSSPSFRFEQKTLPAITTQEQEARALERITYGDLHQQLLEQYAPPSVVVNEEYDIVHLSERAGKYMHVAGGEPSNNLLKAIRPELRLELRSALYQAVGRRTNLEVKNLIVQSDGRRETINIHVRPVLRPDDAARGFLLVLFEPATGAAETSEAAYSSPEPVARQIEEELMKVRAQFRSSSEQHELHAEELKASNEELQAMNEELRSAAEELETSTEELQSVNEELTTVNQELKIKVEEVTQVNNDFHNLINSTDIGTVFLDRSFRVNLFTPAASRIFNLIPADFGRPISDITHRLETDGLLHDAETVLDTLQTIEREARTNDGRTYLLRVLPYRTTEDRINGVVASFIDITERKRAEEAKFFLASIVESSKDSIITVNLNGTITSWNNGAEWLYGYAANEAVGKPVTMLTLPEDLKQVLANIERIRHSQKVEVYDTVRTHKDGHEINLEIVLSPVKDDKGEVIGASTVARDVTGRKRAEANLAFLAEVSQDLVQLTSVRETMNSLGAKIAEHFKVARVAFAEISGDEKTSVIRHEWRQAGLPSLEAASQLKDIFALKPELAQRDGEISYISDVAAVRPDAAQTYTALGIASLLGAPLARDGKWRLYLNILDSEPREWREDEIELMRELTARIRTRLERARAEEAARESEAQYRLFVNAGTDILYKMSADWSEMRSLEGKGFLAGTDNPSLTWLEKYIPDADKLLVQPAIAEAISTKNIFELEHRVIRADGAIGWAFSRAIPFLDESGEIVEWFGAASDITERKHAEEALRASEEQYRTLFESIDEGFCTIEVLFDGQGKTIDYRFLETNPAFVRQTGLENAVGKTVREILPEHEEFWFETYAQIAKTGEAMRFEHEAAALGRIYDVYAFRIGEPSENRVAILFNDIGERRKAEEAVRESEGRLRAMVENLPGGAVFVVSRDLRYLLAEGEALAEAGFKSEDLVGRTIFEAMPPELAAEYEPLFRKALAGEPFDYEHDAHNHSYISRGVPLRSTSGEVYAVLAISYDITDRKQAEKELIASEERLRESQKFVQGIITSVPMALYIFDLSERKNIYLSPQVSEMFGYTAEEMQARESNVLAEFFHPEDLPHAAKHFDRIRASAENQIFEIEYRIRHADGRWVWIKSRDVIYRRDSEGVPTQILGTAEDITHRKRAEESLRESETRFRATFEQANVGIVQLSADEKFIMVNPGFCKIVGYTEEECRNMTVRDLTHPKDYEFEETETRRLMSGEIPGYTLQKRYIHKNGGIVWGTKTATLVRTESGEPFYVLVIVQDISERKRAEEILRESEERFRLLVESAKDYAIFTLDLERRVESWNPGAEAIFGYTGAEIIGQFGDILFTPEDREHNVPEKEARTALAHGRASDERWHARKDGSRFFASGVMRPLGEGEARGFAKIARDLTAQREADEALRRSHEELEARVRERTVELQEVNELLMEEVRERSAAEERARRLVRQIVTAQEDERKRVARDLHDHLGQQLTALQLKLETHRVGITHDEALRARVEEIQTFARQIDNEVDFLAWELRPAALDDLGLPAALQNFIEEWSKHFGIPAEFHTTGFVSAADRLPPEVEINFYRIAQEALNNIYKHAEADSADVIFERRANHVVLIVEDNGKGFNLRTAVGPNDRGIGLINMRERASFVGGTLEIESKVGVGTTIFVRVPISRS